MTTDGTSPLSFEVIATDPSTGARRGRVTCRHGVIETPAFMPVGTQGTVKTLHPDEVWATGARIMLANTYHLMLRPGAPLVKAAGGLHRFISWNAPILTDSGGFQVFSLAHNARVIDTGVTFRSHLNGDRIHLSPERAIELQLDFGADIIMALDHFVGLPATREATARATARTALWLDRCIEAYHRLDGPQRGSSLFAICQGGMEPDLRRESAQMVAETPVAGCAIGGLSVGEAKPVMHAMLEEVGPLLPPAKPRYLMGVGSPEDLWHGVRRGVDLFDCVLPTRLARNGALFTADGRIDIHARRYAEVHDPIETDCDCATCSRFSAAYLHHLFRAREILGLRLASVHNLRFLSRQMDLMRSAIENGCFGTAFAGFTGRYQPVTRTDGG